MFMAQEICAEKSCVTWRKKVYGVGNLCGEKLRDAAEKSLWRRRICAEKSCVTRRNERKE